MAIIMRQELLGLTDEQAAAIASVVNERARTAPGFIAHASGPTPDGYQVTEFWESREAFEAFSEAVVGPLMMRLG
ncbi:MAG: antibiotic biosynthesis monooxygenase, partial [Ktedonobacterales bacterium]